MPDFLSIYHALPPSLQSIAASLHGYRLRWWRYGSDTDRRVREALERDYWTREQWQAWQEDETARLLNRAATRVPYYRDYWQSRRSRGDATSWERLENWPILDKEAVRERPRAFLADDCRTSRMYEEHTSGTTGKPLKLWWSRDTVRKYYALYEARVRAWHGVDRSDSWAILGGQLVVPYERSRPPYWVWNKGLRQLYLSVYHLKEDTIDSYFQALEDHGCRYLIAYPSAAAAIASLAGGRKPPNFEMIITNAEPLLDAQRATIEAAFECPVRNTYGMAEIVTMATECEHGSLHLWPELGITEVLNERGQSTADGGRLVCTGLLNQDMPLIRYDVGDQGRLAGSAHTCECTRTLPILCDIEGRSDDVVITRDGRRIGRLDPVFKKDMPLREAQIIQESLEVIRVRYVPTDGFERRHEDAIATDLRRRIGDVHIYFDPVDHIPRTANGKLRAVVSRVGASGNPSHVAPNLS